MYVTLDWHASETGVFVRRACNTRPQHRPLHVHTNAGSGRCCGRVGMRMKLVAFVRRACGDACTLTVRVIRREVHWHAIQHA